ncbi:RNA-binding S4 domain-containing protein [Anaerosalibacter bizertensis]|uniref:RNA-binding S4 domain-containing protein n=1 Tax=Anaerosalibacter bizertensis TaxID=932217 RepID=UPI00175FD866|nr:RNA-binding S4 domain-containing protein [Anaerosalibacter bizertensis]MBU5293442.1 RNA-binding S4 domain-containing protein [Anaerosalibacter bizertensis]HHV26529.1 RNA-binding S4 domain-containing protein [Tissierellia bacterium]
MRVDKYLKNSRLIKRRTMAKEACEQGRVYINGKVAKPGDEVKVEDIIEIRLGTGSVKVKVLSTKDNVPKNQAQELYRNL